MANEGLSYIPEVKAPPRPRKKDRLRKRKRAGKQSACDIDWENHKEKDEEPDHVMRARAADWQLHEAMRIAEEFALLRPGTRATEIKLKHIAGVVRVSRLWAKLAKALTAKQGA